MRKTKTTITGTEEQTINNLLSGFDDRFQKVIEELKKLIKDDDKILDIGCGEGKIWQLFHNVSVTGLDISSENLRLAQKYLKPIRGNAEKKLPFPSESFDVVIASEIIEHLVRPEMLLKEIDRVLIKNGYAIITLPNTASIQMRLSLLLWGRNPSLNYPENNNHIRFYDLADLTLMLHKTNLKITKVRGGNFLSFGPNNFGKYIPVPRAIRVIGGDLFPKLSLGFIVILKKN